MWHKKNAVVQPDLLDRGDRAHDQIIGIRDKNISVSQKCTTTNSTKRTGRDSPAGSYATGVVQAGVRCMHGACMHMDGYGYTKGRPSPRRQKTK